MTNTLLEVRESDGDGYYPVIYRGVEYALTSELRLDVGPLNYFDLPFSSHRAPRRYSLVVQFMELPPKPEPKPKRRMSDLGLRRPK